MRVYKCLFIFFIFAELAEQSHISDVLVWKSH